MNQARFVEAPAETTILRRGEAGDAAFFILSGKLVAGITTDDGDLHSLETMTSGDFFGEIAALTGAARMADVITLEPTKLVQVPSPAMRNLMGNQALGTLFLGKMTQRLSQWSLKELPRFAGYDQRALRDLFMRMPL